MRKILLLIILLTAGSAKAQYNTCTLGIEGGFNVSKLRGDVIDDLKSLTSTNIGLTFSYHFNDQLALKTGFYFEKKGARQEGQITDNNGHPLGDHEFRHIFKYYTVPLLLNYTVRRKVDFFVNAGPYIAFLNEKLLEGEDVPGYGDISLDQTSETKPNEFGLTLGIGFGGDVSPRWRLSFEIRDNVGISNIQDIKDDVTVCTNSLNFLPGVAFKF